jgi:cardiolipin synthase A/B
MCLPQLIVQPDHGIEPVIAMMRSATHEILLKQFTFDHPVLLDEVIARHADGLVVRVLLNEAKAVDRR